uniref:Uncharacterized protein n=1 Tax=Ixodes ricinus TaxID=34613 RepID=A0A6B0U984_IXORI
MMSAVARHHSSAVVPFTLPCCRCSSSSLLVFSSSSRMSLMVMPCHRSIQQNTCRWKLWKILRSIFCTKASTRFWSPNHLNSTVTSL